MVVVVIRGKLLDVVVFKWPTLKKFTLLKSTFDAVVFNLLVSVAAEAEAEAESAVTLAFEYDLRLKDGDDDADAGDENV